MPRFARVFTVVILICFITSIHATESELEAVVDQMCATTADQCGTLKNWCESPEAGSKNPVACVLINFVKTLEKEAQCRADPDPKECMKWLSGFDASLQNMISQTYTNKRVRAAIDKCIAEYSIAPEELGLNAQKQMLLEQALDLFQQEYTLPLRIYDSRLVINCLQTDL